MKELYEAKLGGYIEIAKIIVCVRQYYDFPKLRKVVKDIIHQYETYSKAKADRYKPYGLLKPLSIPERIWGSIIMDFITKLPRSKDSVTEVTYDSIWVIMDRMTKWAYFLPFFEKYTAK